MKKILYILAISVVVFACENDDDSQAGNNNNPGTIDSTATYRVTFTSVWTSTTHPIDFPSGAHFSPIIGLTHNSSASIYSAGTLASPGIKNMAETGSINPLNTEILSLIMGGQAQVLITGSGIGTPASTSETFMVSIDYSEVSMVTMVAPSPDWFLGIKDVNLIENGDWVSTKTVAAAVYDSGTDSGVTFQSADSVSSPAENIHLITTAPLADVNGKVATMGTFTFERIN